MGKTKKRITNNEKRKTKNEKRKTKSEKRKSKNEKRKAKNEKRKTKNKPTSPCCSSSRSVFFSDETSGRAVIPFIWFTFSLWNVYF